VYSGDDIALMGCESQPDADDDSKQHNDTLCGFTDSVDLDTRRSVRVLSCCWLRPSRLRSDVCQASTETE
jgi:hypothetical protein